MRALLTAVLILLPILVNAQDKRVPKVSALTLYQQAFDYEGKVVAMTGIDRVVVEQVSKEQFEVTIWISGGTADNFRLTVDRKTAAGCQKIGAFVYCRMADAKTKRLDLFGTAIRFEGTAMKPVYSWQ